eukprot:11614599-Heterocapsa_arctica.AAC.1
MEAAARQSKERCNSKCSPFKSLESKSNHGKGIGKSELKKCLVDQHAALGCEFIKKGIDLGNQNHSTDMLALSPFNIMKCLTKQRDTYRERRLRREIKYCRIGEAEKSWA